MVRWLNKIFFLSCGIFFTNCLPYVQPQRYPQLVRVAILTEIDSARISGIIDSRYFEDYQVRITDSLPIVFKPKDGKVAINDKLYYGSLETKNINGKIWIINTLEIEDYLRGVVPCEIGKINRKLIEAAKAQAIAARTYAYAHLHQYEKLGFDLYATVRDQVYGGITVEDTLINKAIMETRGLVLIYNGEPIDAKYHSTCGGYTADFTDAWGGNPIPYLKSAECGFCNDSPHFSWQKILGRKEFFKNLRDNLAQVGIPISDSEVIKGFTFKRNLRSKRVVKVKILTNKKEYIIPAYNIRKIFGSREDPGGLLKSSNFAVTVKDDSIIVEGRGFGHGIGMCQFGAIGMAKKGKKYRDILKYYYPETKISRIYGHR